MSGKTVQLTKAVLNEAKNTVDMMEIESLKDNFVENYRKTTGNQNGEIIFERERILFLRSVQEQPKLEKCDNLSKYMCLIQLAASGLTLNEGQCYIIPYKDKATFQIGWKGRLEQIGMLPNVLFIREPKVVYKGDKFEFELGDEPRIIEHKPCKISDRMKDDSGRHVIEYVYLVVKFKHGFELYIMDRDEVLAIRDQYSDSYKYYMKRGGKWDNGSEMDLPMWLSSEPEAFKKTVVKRAYKHMTKSGHVTDRLNNLDKQIQHNPSPESDNSEIDYGVTSDDIEEAQVIDDMNSTLENQAGEELDFDKPF